MIPYARNVCMERFKNVLFQQIFQPFVFFTNMRFCTQDESYAERQIVHLRQIDSVYFYIWHFQDWKEIQSDLRKFGARVADDIYELHLQCENNPPRHQPFDSWGHRVDKLITCEAWKKMKSVSAEEGLVSIAYERKFGEYR